MERRGPVGRLLQRIRDVKPSTKVGSGVLMAAAVVTVAAFAMNQPQVQAWLSVRAHYGLGSIPESRCETDALDLQAAMKVIDPVVDYGIILDVQVARSETMPGRVDVDVATRVADVAHHQMVIASGLYGRPGDDDYRVRTSPSGVEELLETVDEATCGQWYRSAELEEDHERTQHWTYEGLWAYQDYCFVVATAPTHAGLFHSAAARSDVRCVSTDWEWSWGAVDFPSSASADGGGIEERPSRADGDAGRRDRLERRS